MALKLGELEVEIGADTSGLKKAEKEGQWLGFFLRFCRDFWS